MKAHRKPAGARARSRGSKKEIPALVDEAVELNNRILKGEESLRERRAKLMEAGRPDLARKFLSAPSTLRDLAAFLWRNEPLVVFSTPPSAASDGPPLWAAQYPKKFTLRRLTSVRPVEVSENWYQENGRHVLQIWLSKIRSDVNQAVTAAAKRGKRDDAINSIRRLAIACAPLYPLEEWACIFPEAAAAGDTKFIEEVIASHREPKPLSDEYTTLCVFWHGFQAAGYHAKVPPLKYWSDEAAWQFVCFLTSNAKLTLKNYQKIKSRSGLHSERPVLVTFADYSRDGIIERLTCRR